jgi:hypothetical protein
MARHNQTRCHEVSWPLVFCLSVLDTQQKHTQQAGENASPSILTSSKGKYEQDQHLADDNKKGV